MTISAELALVGLLLAAMVPHHRAAPIPGRELQILIDAAIASGDRQLQIPPGDYLFNTTHANLEVLGAENLVIDAAGVTVWLWPGAFVDVRDSEHSTIRDLTVDYSPPCFSQGSVAAVYSANHSFELVVESGFLPPDIRLHPQFNATEVKLIYWSPTTRLMLQQPGSNPWDPTRSSCVGPRCTITLGDRSNPLPAIGDLVTASPRIGANMVIQTWYTSGYRHTNCSEMSAVNITMHGAGSMGFGEFGGEGGNNYTDCRNIRRPASSHLLSSNHDGFHSVSANFSAASQHLLHDAALSANFVFFFCSRPSSWFFVHATEASTQLTHPKTVFLMISTISYVW